MIKSKDELKNHFCSGSFLLGVAKKKWKLLDMQWPIAFVEVSARDGRLFTLKFDCTGYPDTPPTGTLWDMVKQLQLNCDLWPSGGRVSTVFNPQWKSGAALYIPCDRQSIEGHPNWLTEYPWLIWDPSFGLLQYIEAVYEILQSNELVSQAA